MRQRQGSATDLVTLGHPLVFLSIIVLVINDHVLKVYSPSWLTGKLSDFAGLFFFPILLSAILNIVFKPLHLQPRQVAWAAFASTAFWFFQIKTQPFFANLTESGLSHLLSHPTQIVSDATDLLALVMLWPAWRLRARIEERGHAGTSRYSYLTLCLASIATLATSPALPREIRHLIVYENTIYTYIYDDEVFQSPDGGMTWIKVDSELSPQVTSELGQLRELPVTVCLPDDPKVCYRTGEEEIVKSLDGGKTWITSWNIPAGRRRYMERFSYQLTLGPYDLVLLELEGRHVVVAAMGSEGVLVKTDEGAWRSYAVGYAGPMPAFQARSIRKAMSAVSTELYWISFISVVLLFLNVLANANRRDDKGFGALKTVALVSIISAILTIFLAVTALGGGMFFISGIISLVCALAAALLLFQQLLTNSTRRGVAGLIILIIVWLISCAFFILWAFGIIPVYETALNGAIVLDAAYLLWFLYELVAKMLKKGERPAAPSAGA